MTTVFLPWPMSTNAIWRAVSMGGKPRNILSKKYREWKAIAVTELNSQPYERVAGPVCIKIDLSPPTKRAFDLDNKVKCLLDVLTEQSIIEDDSCNIVKNLSVGLDDWGLPGARITIKPWKGFSVA